ncbi:hypothetical protein OXX69_007857, partial [Metschnikowia pulcherrima]
NFILNLISYPLNVVNTFVAIGLLYLKYKNYKGEKTWNPPIRTPFLVVVFFGLSSLYLIVAPYIPPTDGQSVYNSLPYWIHPVVTWAIFAVGAIYWVIWSKILPRIGGYTLVVKEVLGSDGFWKNKFLKVPYGVDPEKFAEEAINEDAILEE